MSQDLVGKSIIDRYEIVEQIGEGGMAVVYKARDKRLERFVAVKVIRTEKFAVELVDTALKRFKRESKTLARLTHPNIVQITDTGEFEGKPFLVMSYIHGGTLKQLLGRPIPWRDAARMLIPIARALQHAHQQGIIHRDVKPSNILLTEAREPLLTDFGIAKLLLDTEETSDLTGTGMGIGTPEYMSPEQFQGEGVDARTDIYSLGVVFYEMVTGRKPYTATTPAALLVKQATEPLPRPSTFVTGIPENVENALARALAKKTDDRYANMGEFLRALESIAEGTRLPVSELTGTATVDESFDASATLRAPKPTYATVDESARPRTYLPTPPPPPPVRKSNWLPWVMGLLGLCAAGVIAIVVIAALSGSLGNGTSANPEPTTYKPPTLIIPTNNPTARPADTQRPTDVPPPVEPPTQRPDPTDTPKPTDTPSCPGAKYPTRLKADREARVCTQTDRLIVRQSARMNAPEVLSLYPGTYVRILEGPVCADNFWWWKIEIYPGTVYGLQGYAYNQTSTTNQTYYGWAREGWDEKDSYFLCQ